VALLARVFRGQGIGTSLLRGVLAQGPTGWGRAIALHVENAESRPCACTRRLGFLISGEAGLYFEMCRPLTRR